MRIRSVIPVFMLLFATSSGLYAQKLLWDVDFKFGLDNREYAGMETSPSFTAFGAILAPKAGLGWGNGHSVMAGAAIERYFGQVSPLLKVSPLLYYQYEGRHFNAYAGALPMKKLSGDYPRAFFDDMLFFDPVLEGALFRYGSDTWELEAAVDWLSCLDTDVRERFAVYSYGRKDFAFFRMGYSMMMHHFSISGTLKNVVDNIWIYPFLRLDFSGMTPLSQLFLKAGWIQTFQNDRANNTGYVLPGGFQGEFAIEKWGVGISETVYAGGNLQPFFHTPDAKGNIYGTELYFGDRFYGTDSGIYNRTELYYAPDIGRFLSLKISFAVHYDGYGWGTQQLVRLIVNLDDSQFRTNGKKHRNSSGRGR